MPTSTLGLIRISPAVPFCLFIHIFYVFDYLCVVCFIDLINLFIYTSIYYLYILSIYVLCLFIKYIFIYINIYIYIYIYIYIIYYIILFTYFIRYTYTYTYIILNEYEHIWMPENVPSLVWLGRSRTHISSYVRNVN